MFTFTQIYILILIFESCFPRKQMCVQLFICVRSKHLCNLTGILWVIQNFTVRFHVHFVSILSMTVALLKSTLRFCNIHLGHTCSVVRLTKLMVRWYLLPLKMDNPGVVLVVSNLGGLPNQHGPVSERYPISFNGKRYQWTTVWSNGPRNKYDPALYNWAYFKTVLQNSIHSLQSY